MAWFATRFRASVASFLRSIIDWTRSSAARFVTVGTAEGVRRVSYPKRI